MKYCDFNGCHNKIASGAYCDEHKRKRPRRKQRNKDVYHSKNKSFYNSSAWQQVRSYVYELAGGCCQRCGQFVFGRRAHTHHIIPISVDETLKLEVNNLKLLCPECHMIEENEENEKNVFPNYFG